MRKMIASALGAIAALTMAPAAQAAVFGPEDMDIEFGPDGSISAHFGNSGIAEGVFTDIYNFILPTNGTASGSITTSAVTFGDVTDLDFTTVFFNGIQLTGVTGAQNEVVFANAVPILAGALNTITINGLSRGNGSYGGQGVFLPASAVPEPGTWALMLAGFGSVGYSLRGRRKRALLQAV